MLLSHGDTVPMVLLDRSIVSLGFLRLGNLLLAVGNLTIIAPILEGSRPFARSLAWLKESRSGRPLVTYL